MRFGASSYIKRSIMQLLPGEMFTTRDMLHYGNRNAVDQCLSRLVKDDILRRLIPGVFMRNDAGVPNPPMHEIIKVKIESFGRKLFTSAKNAAKKIGLVQGSVDDTEYATDGRSTTFHYSGIRITVKGLAPRKLAMGDSKIGLIIRGFWGVGKLVLTELMVSNVVASCFRDEKEQLWELIDIMPWWMSNFLTSKRIYWKDRKRPA